MGMARSGAISSITVPAQWPEWFDSAYTADRAPPRPRLRKEPDAAERARVIAGFERLKRELKSMSLGMKNPKGLPLDRIRPYRGPVDLDEGF